MAISKELKAKLVKEYGGSETNTGKVDVQIAILSAEIDSLTVHLKNNHKDNSSKRGLYKKVSQRKSLLTYLKNRDINQYRELIKKINIRG